MSKHEIITALNNPDDFILALVEVDEDAGRTRTVYLACPFAAPPDFASVAVQYSVAELLRRGNVLYEGGSGCGGVPTRRGRRVGVTRWAVRPG